MFTVIAEDEVTVEEIEKLVKNENFETLNDAQISSIAAALSDESDAVKEVFEDEVNIFDGVTDEYVPSGSTVTVSERRIIIAATAIVMTVPIPSSKHASTPSSGRAGGSAPSGGGGSSSSEGESSKKRKK